MKKKYEKLFTPMSIGNMKCKNRLVMPPMVTVSCTKDGMVTDAMVDYYAERAKGGTGMIIIEFAKCEMTLESWMSALTLRIDTHAHQCGYTALTEAIHKHGAKAVIQISPGCGSWIMKDARMPPGFTPIGPTEFTSPIGRPARPLTIEQIEFIVDEFGKSTLRAKEAGFDCVDIHGHASYLLSQFMTPYVNNRTDKYGDLWRLPVELLEASKKYAGADYPMMFRISANEYIEGGRDVEGTIDICQRMVDAGLDCISVSNGTYYTPASNCTIPYMTYPKATWEADCKEMRNAFKDIPLIVAGRLNNPDDAIRILEDGTSDFIAIGRGHIADPHLANKIADGKEDEIRQCLACNYCIGTLQAVGSRMECVVNSQCFKEKEREIVPAERSKRVVIVGGGPGGMEAARIASIRGHQVILFEADKELGGQLVEAGKPPHKEPLEELRQSFIAQLSRQIVDVRLNTEFTVDMLDYLKPDVVILAAGLTPWAPPIKGVDSDNVVHSKDVLLGKVETGEKVAVVGAELVGCETALLLADQGKTVTLMRRGPVLAAKVNMYAQGSMIGQLAMKGVTVHTEVVSYDDINSKGINISKKDEKIAVEADTIVLAAGGSPKNDLLESIQAKMGIAGKVISVGDCIEPRSAKEAISEGFKAGMDI